MTIKGKKLRKAAEFEVFIPQPFDFDLTVAKPAGWNWCSPGERYEEGVIWAGFYLSEHPIGLKLYQSSSQVVVEVFGSAGISSEGLGYVRHAVEYGLGKNVDMKGFYEFAGQEPVLDKAVEDLHGMRPGRLDDIFGRVILAISLQMAQLKRSRAMMSDILKYYGTKLIFDDKAVILWPSIEHIASLEVEELRDKANMGYRAKLLSSAARYLAEHPLSMLGLEDMDEREAASMVRKIPGVGEYSAGIAMGRSSAPIDSWSVVIMSELLLGITPERPRQHIDTMNALIKERWGKWGWIAFVYIMNDLANLSRIYHLSRLT